MEAAYFYYRPSDLVWNVNSVKGHYLDKGFNVKFIYKPKRNYLPNIALGMDDFAGTGYFSREYIVSTLNLSNAKISLGMGWGKFTGENSYRNPLISLSESFKYRPEFSDNYNFGGTPTYDKWFRGGVAIFGGIEYSLSKIDRLNIKIEYDPFDYKDLSANSRDDAILDLREKDSDINFGLSYAVNDYFSIDASYIKGNTFNLSFNIGITFNDNLVKKPKFSPTIKNSQIKDQKKNFYDDLLFNLNNNNLLLQTAELKDNEKLDLTISTSNHRNAIRSSSYAGYISNVVSKYHEINLSAVNISHLNAGIELNNITYISKHLDDDNNIPIELIVRNTKFKSGNSQGYINDEFRPVVPFPVFFQSLRPSIVSHIGNPEKFYFGGLNLQHIGEMQLSRKIILSSELNYRLYDNFKSTVAGPASNLEHVRTDLVEYLKEDGAYISRLQLDYIWSPKNNIYSKLSAGIFETMYGGFGGQILYKPFENNFSVGAELFFVKQRSFNQKFKFSDYKTTTGHINFSYIFAKNIEANLSFGRYLAKDDGYTFDISRKTKSGFKAGIYFTRTNISAELFGEGSFDKGFYFQIPLDILSDEYVGNYSSFKLSPLTRDGGAKLLFEKDLKGLIYNSTMFELSQQWDGFLN